MIEQIISDGKLLIEQTKFHDSSMGPVSVLLEGNICRKSPPRQNWNCLAAVSTWRAANRPYFDLPRAVGVK